MSLIWIGLPRATWKKQNIKEIISVEKNPGEDLGGILHFYHEIRHEFVRNEDSRKGGIAVKDLYLAGGPYYGVQEVFSRIKGVVETTAGFANSSVPNPRKEDVENGKYRR